MPSVLLQEAFGPVWFLQRDGVSQVEQQEILKQATSLSSSSSLRKLHVSAASEIDTDHGKAAWLAYATATRVDSVGALVTTCTVDAMN